MRCVTFLLSFWLTAAAAFAAAEPVQGVSKTEIVLGAVLDLSGPMSAYGRQTRQGMLMRVFDINREGGVNGRMLRLVVADSGSDASTAAAVAKTLVEHDQVFAMLGTLGGPAARAVMPVAMKRNVINFLPIASGRNLYDPPDPLKVAFVMSTADQLRTALPFILSQHHYQYPCTIAEEGEYAGEVASGTEAGFAHQPHGSVARFDYRRGDQDAHRTVT